MQTLEDSVCLYPIPTPSPRKRQNSVGCQTTGEVCGDGLDVFASQAFYSEQKIYSYARTKQTVHRSAIIRALRLLLGRSAISTPKLCVGVMIPNFAGRVFHVKSVFVSRVGFATKGLATRTSCARADDQSREIAIRLSLGKQLVNLLQVVKRTNTPLIPQRNISHRSAIPPFQGRGECRRRPCFG